MKKAQRRRIVFIMTFFVLLSLISFYFDARIAMFMPSIQNNFLTGFFSEFGSMFLIIFFVILLTALFAYQKKGKWIAPLWFSAALSVIVSLILKVWIQRLRPFQLGLVTLMGGLEKARYFVWDYSFPSFHTMLIFSVLPFLDKEFPRIKYIWIALAVIVGFSRVYFGLHFLSDVLAGGLIGYLIGTLVLRAEEENGFLEKIYRRFI